MKQIRWYVCSLAGLMGLAGCATSDVPDTSNYLFPKEKAPEMAVPIIKRYAADDPDFCATMLEINKNEGTGFVRAEGSHNTVSEDGVTWGVVGFTSFNGDLYSLLESGFSQMTSAQEAELANMGNLLLGNTAIPKSKAYTFAQFDNAYRTGLKLAEIFEKEQNQPEPRDALANLALYTGPARKELYPNVEAFFGWLGLQDYMVKAQMAQAKKRYQLYVEFAQRTLGGRQPSLTARILFYDMYTLSDGIREETMDALGRQPFRSEEARMRQVVNLALARMGEESTHYGDAKMRWEAILNRYKNG